MSDPNLTVIIETAAKVARAGMAFSGASFRDISSFDDAMADWKVAHDGGFHASAVSALNRAADIVPAMMVTAGIYQAAVMGKTIKRMAGR